MVPSVVLQRRRLWTQTQQVFAACEGGLLVIFSGRGRKSDTWVRREKNAGRIRKESNGEYLDDEPLTRLVQGREKSKWIKCQSQ